MIWYALGRLQEAHSRWKDFTFGGFVESKNARIQPAGVQNSIKMDTKSNQNLIRKWIHSTINQNGVSEIGPILSEIGPILNEIGPILSEIGRIFQ